MLVQQITKEQRSRGLSLGMGLTAAATAGLILVNTAILSPDRWRAGEFVATMGLVSLALVGLGLAIVGRPSGLIIDDRNRMSLSKLQLILWTIVTLSAFLTLASCRIRSWAANPLDIGLPSELLTAMGIATASFVAAPIILSTKAAQLPTLDNLAKATTAAAAQGAVVSPSGKVHARSDAAQARYTDVLRGDEVGNAGSPDLGKIQQFAITLLLVGLYTAALIAAFASFEPANIAKQAMAVAFPNALPKFSPSLVTLMAISHASYLAYKAAPHTSTGSEGLEQVVTATVIPSASNAL